MGWTSSADTQAAGAARFASKDEAIPMRAPHCLRGVRPKQPKRRVIAYADNSRFPPHPVDALAGRAASRCRGGFATEIADRRRCARR